MEVLLDEEYRNELLEHLCNAIKQIQMELLSKTEEMSSKGWQITFTNDSPSVGTLCSSLEMIFSHRLKNRQAGWWECVRNFCRRDLIRQINQLQNVKTNAGKSRAWLFISLNEKELESYLLSFQIDKKCMQNYYDQYAIVCGSQVSAIQTLISGLDPIAFDLCPDVRYLDFRISSFPLPYNKKSKSKIHIADKNRGSVVHIDTSALTNLATKSSRRAVGFVKQMLNSDADIYNTNSSTYSELSLSNRTNLGKESSNLLVANGCRECIKKNALICLCPSDNIESPFPSGYAPDEQHAWLPSVSYSPTQAADLLTEDMQFPLPMSRSLGRDRYNPFNELNDQNLSQISQEKPEEMHRFDAKIEIKDAPIKVHRRHKKRAKNKEKLSDSGSDLSLCVSEESLNNKNADVVFEEDEKLMLSYHSFLTKQSPLDNVEQDIQFKTEAEIHTDETPSSSIFTRPLSQNSNILENCREEVEQDNHIRSELGFSDSFSSKIQLLSAINQPNTEKEITESLIDQLEIKEANTRNSPIPFNNEEQNGKSTVDMSTQYIGSQSPLTKEESRKEDLSSDCITEVNSVEFTQEENVKTLTSRLNNTAQDLGGDASICNNETYHTDSVIPHHLEHKTASLSVALADGDSNNKGDLKCASIENVCIASGTSDAQSSFDPQSEPENEHQKHPRAPDIDNTLRLYFLLEILHDESERILRFFQVSTGHSEGNWSPLFLLFTDCFLYFLVNSNGKCPYESLYSASYANINHISIGYNAQNMLLVFYHTESSNSDKVNSASKRRIKLPIDTADSLLTNLITSTMSEAFSLFAKQNGVVKVCPAIFHDSKEHQISLVKCLQSEGLSNDIKFYQLIYWEDPQGYNDSLSAKISLEGFLKFKVSSLLRSSWKEAFFVLQSGILYHYRNKESAKPDMIYNLKANNCTGCKRSKSSSGLQFELTFRDKRRLELMGENNEQVTEWLQSLCLIVSLDMMEKPEIENQQLNNDMLVSCSLIVADEHVVLCHEDSHTGFIRSLATIPSSSLIQVSVDELTERACEMLYENNSSSTSKCTIYFPSSYCLQSFKSSIEAFHKIPVFASLTSSSQHCKEALALLDSRWTRANSLLQGREL